MHDFGIVALTCTTRVVNLRSGFEQRTLGFLRFHGDVSCMFRSRDMFEL